MKSITISSGHGLYVRGASCSPIPPYLDEVDEARRIVDRTAEYLRAAGCTVKVYHDNTSKDKSTNLNTIVSAHNKTTRQLDVSVHLNAYTKTSKPMGCECLFKTQEALAKTVSSKVAKAGGFLDRGGKYRSDLKFLNSTTAPAVLAEICFVDSSHDGEQYTKNFDAICHALAEALAGETIDQGVTPPKPVDPGAPDTPDQPPPPADRPTVAKGDKGEHVESVQISIGLIPDGDFGSVTESGVKGFQAAAGLKADGVVGQKTWAELDALDERKGNGDDGLTYEQSTAIVEIANASKIAKYKWRDRGVAPQGYTAGIALCFALAVTRLGYADPAFDDMAVADRDNPDKDALSWYAAEFKKLNMDNSQDGVDTLRHLFVMLLGLGLRESSGRYCEGRDMSAENVSAETAETSMHQTSYNIRSSNPNIAALLQEYWDNPNGFLGTFRLGVFPDSNDLGVYGSGDGAKHQFISRFAPAYHAFVTALGMRYLRQHWGPINRREVELRPEADEMFQAVQDYLSTNSAEAGA